MTVAFAFSGGGNLGPLQAGTVLALTESGIEPDLMVGTSVGALNAAFLSTRPGLAGARSLRAAWLGLRRPDAFPLDPLVALAGFFGFRDHLVSAHKLRRLIRRWIEIDRIEEATVPLAITATDAVSGEAVLLRSGDIADALIASAAIPGLFPPVLIDGRWLIDGSLSANQPALEAQDLGADEVYVISTTTAPRRRPPKGAVAVAMNAVSLVTARVAQQRLEAALTQAATKGGRVLVVPSAQPTAPGPFDFTQSATLAQAAYVCTNRWLATRVRLGNGPTNQRHRAPEPRRPPWMAEAPRAEDTATESAAIESARCG